MDRDEFMELVYETFADEPDNVFANGIIEAADAYVEHEIAQLSQEGTTKDATSDLQPTCNQLATDCISRQAEIDAIEPWQNVKGYSEGELNMLRAVLYELRNLPPAQPEPKTGRWINHIGMNEECSECRQFFPLSYFKNRPFDINYCPNCGARMKEK